ncbi:unnamed protein product, partial [Rotaria sp. Silwood1]
MPYQTLHPNCGEPIIPPINNSTNSTIPSPCQNGGVLVNGACKCPSGYNGTNCQLKQ